MQRCGSSYCENGTAVLKVMLTDFTGADQVSVSRGIFIQMATPDTIICRRKLQWWGAGLICGESVTRQ